MGVLTEQMTQLHQKVVASRREREIFKEDLARASKENKAATLLVLAVFAVSRAKMARRMRADLARFIAALRRTVAWQRREIRVDLAGGRRAWSGLRAARPSR